jgi:hypothetical protein
VAYPASGINSGDLLIGLWANDGTDDLPTWPSGDWADNELYQQNSGHGGSISYIIADGTENGGTFEVTHNSETTCSYILHIENWHGTTAPEVGTRVAGATNDWEIVSVTPAGWDSSVDDTLWLLYMSNDDDDTLTLWPSEFADNRTELNSGSASGPSGRFATDDTLEATSAIAEVLTAFTSHENRITCIVGIRGAIAGGATPHYALGHPLYGPFRGPIG